MKASVIISVYKDVEALNCVLYGLTLQTEKDFEVIVTEDGEDPAMATYLKERAPKVLDLRHLTQEDLGFRKTRAVNRAVAAARSEYLIFLDGDCIPHHTLVATHLDHSKQNVVLAGRRMHLGKNVSKQLRNSPDTISRYESWIGLMRNFLQLHKDGIRNFELGAPNSFFQSLAGKKRINLVGCNFSCFKSNFYQINGYDEDLTGVGGEDDDLDWRFSGLGISIKNVKFVAIVYHLWHESRRLDADLNFIKSNKNISAGVFFCANGVRQHQPGK